MDPIPSPPKKTSRRNGYSESVNPFLGNHVYIYISLRIQICPNKGISHIKKNLVMGFKPSILLLGRGRRQAWTGQWGHDETDEKHDFYNLSRTHNLVGLCLTRKEINLSLAGSYRFYKATIIWFVIFIVLSTTADGWSPVTSPDPCLAVLWNKIRGTVYELHPWNLG